MDASKLLAQQKFQQILIQTIASSQDNLNIRVIELIEVIKQQIISEKSQV
ncbi:hypothetical protein QNH39_21665 [Neobacillus novalis]|uniref:Uncharacterized protein n=1 Tax=Neobacillus novalis TaxID=220687 RepID=A0AA95SAB3_9BACI|nr:hypothetical protein [Neobacillus novalis]WHY85199.1 hypothetical protein QNH39_21665 [Neobacillus novalis]